MLRQDGPAERVLLAEGDGLEAGPPEPEREAADATEQVKDEHKVDLGIDA